MIQILDNPSLKAAALYIGLLTLLGLVLALNVVRQRYKARVSMGTGGNEELELAIRAHGNFVEYVPFGLALLIALALLGASQRNVDALGASLFVGRIFHALGLIGLMKVSLGRGLGMLLTWGSLIFGSIAVIVAALA